MESSSRAWARKLAVAIALVLGLLAAALPASAAPTTKNYSASLSDGTTSGPSVTVPSGGQVGVVLKNLDTSQQAFGSAQLDFTDGPSPSAVTAPTGWTVRMATLTNGVRYQVVSLTSANPVPPNGSLTVAVTMPADLAGTTRVTTRVKQSNDFNGTNNDFTLTPANSPPLQIVTQSAGTPCPSSCTPTFTSTVNGVRADLTVTGQQAFTYTAGFTTTRLSCDTIPFGPTVTPEPFRVDTFSTDPVSKTLVLTFPKALANLVPNNGTPLHPVCAGGDFPFPGSDNVGTEAAPKHEGLLLNCSDPAYATAIANLAATGNPYLPMCVSSRARNAGNLIVTIKVESTTFDPRFW